MDYYKNSKLLIKIVACLLVVITIYIISMQFKQTGSDATLEEVQRLIQESEAKKNQEGQPALEEQMQPQDQPQPYMMYNDGQEFPNPQSDEPEERPDMYNMPQPDMNHNEPQPESEHFEEQMPFQSQSDMPQEQKPDMAPNPDIPQEQMPPRPDMSQENSHEPVPENLPENMHEIPQNTPEPRQKLIHEPNNGKNKVQLLK